MSDSPEIDYRRVAQQLLQNDKSKEDVIAQLIKLGLEAHSANALLDQLINRQQDMQDDEGFWRLFAGIAGIILIIIAIVIGFGFMSQGFRVSRFNPSIIVMGLFVMGGSAIAYALTGN